MCLRVDNSEHRTSVYIRTACVILLTACVEMGEIPAGFFLFKVQQHQSATYIVTTLDSRSTGRVIETKFGYINLITRVVHNYTEEIFCYLYISILRHK